MSMFVTFLKHEDECDHRHFMVDFKVQSLSAIDMTVQCAGCGKDLSESIYTMMFEVDQGIFEITAISAKTGNVLKQQKVQIAKIATNQFKVTAL